MRSDRLLACLLILLTANVATSAARAARKDRGNKVAVDDDAKHEGARNRSQTGSRSSLRLYNGLCMPHSTDTIVYRDKNSSHVVIAFDLMKKGTVQVFSWRVIKASVGKRLSSMTEEEIPAVDIRPSLDKKNIVGATGKRHYRKFQRKIRRQMKNCGKKGECKLKSIMTVFPRLKMRKVTFDCDT